MHCGDLAGIQLARSLAAQPDAGRRAALVDLYFRRFGAAEAKFVAAGRADLAVAMRSTLGHWARAEALMRAAGAGDADLRACAARAGRAAAERRRWAAAAAHFERAGDDAARADALYRLGDFGALAALAARLPDGAPLLRKVGGRLASVGLAAEAVAAHVRGGAPRRAIARCVELHEWDAALALAAEHGYPRAEALLRRCAAHLLGRGRELDAVELFRRAGRHGDAARLLLAKAAALARAGGARPLLLKRLHVLAALELQVLSGQALGGTAGAGAGADGAGGSGEARAAASAAASSAPAPAAKTLEGLMRLEEEAVAATTKPPGTNGADAGIGEPGAGGGGGAAAATARAFDAARRGAAAHHFWALAHRQLYAGDATAALRTALALRAYDDILDAAGVWSLLALAALRAGFLATASRALVRLEALPGLPEARRAALADIALAIFAARPPADPAVLREAAAAPPSASNGGGGGRHGALLGDLVALGRDQLCVATGRALPDAGWLRCRRCRHAMIAAEVAARASCPLCHAPLAEAAAAPRAGAPWGAHLTHGARGGSSGAASSRAASSMASSMASSRRASVAASVAAGPVLSA